MQGRAPWTVVVILVALALSAAFPFPRFHTEASTSGRRTVVQTVHGISLSLTLPRSSYPRDALVRAVITARNTTNRQACVYSGGPQNPNGYEPFVYLFDDNVRPIESSILDLFVPYPGPAPKPFPLLPHRQMRFTQYVVLRGPELQTSIQFVANTDWRCDGASRRIVTPRLHVALTAPDTPAVQIVSHGGHLVAAVHYAQITAHSLRYVDAAKCGPDFLDVSEHPEWIRVKILDVTAGCPSPTEWRAVIGTLNHSVAWVQYGQGTNRALLMRRDGKCSDITLQVRPGLNPTPGSTPGPVPAPDAPRGTYTVSLPLYPDATSLTPWVASPYLEYPATAYLQTAGAEYESPDNLLTISAWYASHLRACGWHSGGYSTSEGSAFTSGLTFVSNANPNLSLEMSFGEAPSGDTAIGYGVEWVIYPRRPAASFLHGPFTQLQIALGLSTLHNGSFVQHVIHVAVRNRTAILRLVSAVNSLRGHYTVPSICHGNAPSRQGPAWLSFVRANGSASHAYESGPGTCQGLAVNGKRWLIDTGIVWKQILRLAGGNG